MTSPQARLWNAYTSRFRKPLADRDYDPSKAWAVRRTLEPPSPEAPALEWLRPLAADSTPAMLYVPGGGYCFGAMASHRRHVLALSDATGFAGALVHYRLAPTFPFPAPVDDVSMLIETAFAQIGNGRKIVIGGDSAGANAILVALLARRDRGLRMPDAVFLYSPWTDMRMATRSLFANAGSDPAFGPAALLHKAYYYLNGHPPADPRASPILADLHGLPRMLIHTGSTEVMRDDAALFAERARSAGVDVHYEEWAEMPHVFQLLTFLPEQRAALQATTNFLLKTTNSNHGAMK